MNPIPLGTRPGHDHHSVPLPIQEGRHSPKEDTGHCCSASGYCRWSVDLGMKPIQRRDTKWELSPGGCIFVYGVSYRLRTLWSLCLLPHPVAVGFSNVCH